MSWMSQEVGRLGTEESQLPTRIEVSEEKSPARMLSSWPISYVNSEMAIFLGLKLGLILKLEGKAESENGPRWVQLKKLLGCLGSINICIQ